MNDFLNYDESNVKKKKRNEIIRISKNIFIRDGIHPVTMQQLAKECGISLRSLYYYYKNKEDLAVDIQIQTLGTGWFMSEYNYDDSNTAYDLIKDMINHFVEYANTNEKDIKYITAFDFYFYNEYPSEKYNNHLKNNIHSHTFYEKITSSIKNDDTVEHFGDPDNLVATIFQSIMSYAQRIIYREKAMLSETLGNQGSLEIYSKIILNSIKKR